MRTFPVSAIVLLFCSLAVAQVKITTRSLPNGTQDAQYSATITTVRGSVPFAWSVCAGSLPAGMTLTPSSNTRSATLSGTPTTAATYDFSVTVEGHGGHISRVAYSVTIQPQTGQVVDLTWDAGADNIVGYNIYRGTTNGGPYSQLNTSLLAASNYTDTNVVGGTTYYYVTTEVNNQGQESGYSNQAEAQVPEN